MENGPDAMNCGEYGSHVICKKTLTVAMFISQTIQLGMLNFGTKVEIKNLNASSPLSWKVDYESIKTVTSLQPEIINIKDICIAVMNSSGGSQDSEAVNEFPYNQLTEAVQMVKKAYLIFCDIPTIEDKLFFEWYRILAWTGNSS
ncbi:Uncharacterized protein Rs2_01008 [Raphanus sativus]|nr:Uncharacterized protein Rs2_01008 [Raphanus sativus]